VVEGIFGSVLWLLANLLYIDLKRKGKPGFSRIVLFWMGLPLTWLWFFLLSEGSAPPLEKPRDDAAELLAEIRREKGLEAGPREGGDAGSTRHPAGGP
jgi:hypothetical protein